MFLRRELLLLLLVFAVAAPPRLLGLDVLPPGLHHDEAYEGIDGARILAGARPAFLSENFGREPLYAYVIAPLIGLFGQTPVAVRGASALFGLLGVAGAWFWGRALFGSTTGLLVAALTAASYWHLHESRLGMRPIGLPAFLALASGCIWLAARHGRRWCWPLAGLALGLALLTYLPARLFPAVLIGQAVVGAWAADLRGWRPRALRAGLGSLSVLLVAVAVSAPMWLHFRANPDDFSARSAVVSIFASPEAQAAPVAALLNNVGLNLGMFVWRGDDTVRHNLPFRPAFDPLVAVFFLVGIVFTLRHVRRPEHLVLWLWLPPMMLPGLLSDSAPHFLRAIGILPAVFALPALGLRASTTWVTDRLRVSRNPAAARLPAAAVVLVLAASQALTWTDYFAELPRDPDLERLFDARLARLATVAGDPPADLDLSLPTPGWSHPTVRYLRPRTFEPPAPAVPDRRRVGNVMEYLGYTVEPSPPVWGRPARLVLYFRALREMNASYTVLVRVVDEFGRVWAQSASEPGRGTLPTDTWAAREVVADRRSLELTEGTPAGEYILELSVLQPDRGRPLPIGDASGRQASNTMRLPGFRVAAPASAR